MFSVIKRLFASSAPPNALWKVMEEMDPWLSYERFQALKLPKQHRPTVQGLDEGSVEPGEIEGVRRWAARHHEDYNGINALVHALHLTMESRNVHYLFEDNVVVPVARFPAYSDDNALTLLFSDRVNHLQITSVDEFTTTNGIGDYSLEPLTFSQFETRIERRSLKYLGAAVSHENKDQSLYKGQRLSVSLVRKAGADEKVEVEVTAADVAHALGENGISVAIEDIQLAEPIRELGLFDVTIEVEPGIVKSAAVWVVPAVD